MVACAPASDGEGTVVLPGDDSGVLPGTDGGSPGGPGAIVFSQTIDGTKSVTGIVETEDGYVVAGGADGEAGQLWVAGIDARGQLLWEKKYGGASWEVAYGIAPAADGGYVIVGRTGSKGAGSWDGWVLRVDGEGEIVWDRTLGGDGIDLAFSVTAAPGGGHVVAALYDNTALWLLGLDDGGDKVWEQKLPGVVKRAPVSIHSAMDGGTIVAASKKKGSSGIGWVVKLSAAGEIEWQKEFAGTAEAASAVPRGDGYLIAGAKRARDDDDDDDDDTDAWLAMTDASGEVLWEQVFGGAGVNSALDVYPTKDGGAVIAGEAPSSSGDSSDVLVARVDGEGTPVWEQKFGGEFDDIGMALIETKDGGIAVVGEKGTAPTYESVGWMLKLDANGGNTCTEGEKTYLGCQDEDVVWLDGCGAMLETAETCGEGSRCAGGACVDCSPRDHKGCSEDDVYWFDTCGEKGELAMRCEDGAHCDGGRCETPCQLSNCSASGFSYSCASASSTTDYAYGGSGPEGISSVTTTYDNGHVVTCTFSSSSSGSCRDDTIAACGF